MAVGWLIVALVGACLCIWAGLRIFAGYPRKPNGLRTLTAAEYAFLAGAAEATFPSGGPVPPSGTQAHIPEHLDRYIPSVPARIRFLVRTLFFLFEHATLFFPVGGPTGMRRFSKLPAQAQESYLRSWDESRFFVRRLIFLSLRSLLGLAYLADPAVQRSLGLAPKRIPRPVGEADLLWPSVGEPSTRIPFAAADLTPPSDGAPLDPEGPLHPAYAERGA